MTPHYKDSIKKTWQIMKEVIGRDKLVNKSLAKHLILNNRNTFDKKPSPIALMNILLMLDGNWHLK